MYSNGEGTLVVLFSCQLLGGAEPPTRLLSPSAAGRHLPQHHGAPTKGTPAPPFTPAPRAHPSTQHKTRSGMLPKDNRKLGCGRRVTNVDEATARAEA